MELDVRVRDLDRAVRIYRDALNLPLAGHSHHEGDPFHYHASWGDWTGAPESFFLFSLYPADDAVTRASIGFSVPDVAKLHEVAVAAGLRVVREPEAMPWGTSAVYEDPDGNVISLTELPATDSP